MPITHHEIRVLSTWALAVLVHLRYLSMGTENQLDLGYGDLQVALGWSADGVSSPALNKCVERALNELEAHQLIVKTRQPFTRSTTAPVYQVVARPRSSRFEKLPLELVRQLLSPALGRHGAVLLRTWAAIRLLCGPAGSAEISRTELAALLHANAHSAAQQRRELVALGALFEHARPGRATLTSTSPIPAATQVDEVPGGAGQDALDSSVQDPPQAPVDAVDEAVESATGPRPNLSGGPLLGRRVTPSSGVGSYKETDPYETEKDFGLGPQDRNSELTRDHAAARPPSHTPTTTQQPETLDADRPVSTDRFARAARHFVARCPHIRELSGKTRGQLRQWLAGQLRSMPELELDQALELLAFELDLMDELRDGRPFNHRAALGQVFTRWRLDALAAPEPEPAPETGMPDWYDRGEGLHGPDLETLANRVLPDIDDDHDDPESLLHRCTTTLAGCLLDELETDPAQNIERALDLARSRARILLGLTGGHAALLIVARTPVREAWKVSWRHMYETGQLDTQPTPADLAQVRAELAPIHARSAPQAA